MILIETKFFKRGSYESLINEISREFDELMESNFSYSYLSDDHRKSLFDQADKKANDEVFDRISEIILFLFQQFSFLYSLIRKRWATKK